MSTVIPNTILWVEWKVNPYWVEPDAAGEQRIQWMDHVQLLDPGYAPLSESAVRVARQARRWLVFRSHPRMSGFMLHSTVQCEPNEMARFRTPGRAPEWLSLMVRPPLTDQASLIAISASREAD